MDKLSLYHSEDSLSEDSCSSSSSQDSSERQMETQQGQPQAQQPVVTQAEPMVMQTEINLQAQYALQERVVETAVASMDHQMVPPSNIEIHQQEQVIVVLAEEREEEEVKAVYAQPTLSSHIEQNHHQSNHVNASNTFESEPFEPVEHQIQSTIPQETVTVAQSSVVEANIMVQEANSNTMSANEEEDVEVLPSATIQAAHEQTEQFVEVCESHQEQIPYEQKSGNFSEPAACVPLASEQEAFVQKDTQIAVLQDGKDHQSDDEQERDDNDVEKEMIQLAQNSNTEVLEEQGQVLVKVEENLMVAPKTTDDVVLETPMKVEDSEDSELDQNLLKDQDSEQAFSDDQGEDIKEEAFEEGSDEEALISVVNPIMFTEHVAVMGRVPILFFIPQVEERAKLAALIEANGGRCVEYAECQTYQIRPMSKTELDFNFFYAGKLYDEQWIKDSVQIGRMLSPAEYELGVNDSPHAMRLNMGKRKKITIVEGMRLYKLLGAGKYEKVSMDTYKGIERQGYLPERSAETMKNFWKEYHSKPLEQYLVEALFYKWDYCLSFKEIPNEDFEEKHRKQFALEFSLLHQEDCQHAYENHNQGVLSGAAFSHSLNMDSDSSDEDPFNEKVTQKLDELQKKNEDKFSVLDNLASPQTSGKTLQNELQTRETAQFTGQTDESKLTMIDTTGSAANTKAFDVGASQAERRIDLSSLIDDGSTPVQQKGPMLKNASTTGLSGVKRSYNMFSGASKLCLTEKSRLFSTLDRSSQIIKQKRFKKYTPQPSEYAAYEPWEFAKQMDLEILQVKTNYKSYVDQDYTLVPKFYRKSTRMDDQEGFEKWLMIEMEQLAQEFSKDIFEVIAIFEQVNCNKKATRERLAGETFCTWKRLEDLILKQFYESTMKNGGVAPAPDSQYKCLVDEKGLDEIRKRNKFLGLAV